MAAKRVIGFVVSIVFIAAWFYVDHHYGRIDAFRVFGAAFVITSIVFIFLKEIPVGIRGRPPSFHIKGWKKIFVIAPGICLGMAILIYPNEMACYINLRGYEC